MSVFFNSFSFVNCTTTNSFSRKHLWFADRKMSRHGWYWVFEGYQKAMAIGKSASVEDGIRVTKIL